MVEGMPSKVGDAAWSLKGLEFIKGKAVKIEAGKVYIVEFWATWCGPCLMSIPHLTDVAHKYKDKNVVVVGISKEEADVASPFVDKQGAKMDYNVAVDPTGNVTAGYMKAFKFNGIPHAFIVDAKGKIAWHGHPMADMEQVLDEVLAGTFDAAGYAAKRAEEQAKQEAELKTYQAYFENIRSGGTMEEARGILGNWLDEASDDGLNSLAWKILTQVEKDKRDVKLALDAAEKANKLTKGKDGNILDTYALALFENGKVEEAIDVQTKALEAVKGSERMKTKFQKRLDEYRAAKKE
ncbi:MAG: redoxin domain-containing protein [Sedimentisphaerales bacterium]|nr:redoxin domain-containing protein [Sedimentisphaerales bacterium]